MLRRPLSICHPVAHFLLCKEIVTSWTQIQPLIAGSQISATHPEEKTTGRAIDGHWPQNARAELAQQHRLGKRFLLQADVSRFYSSIYTHSIPWAIHSKPVSKANHAMTLLGNRLDLWVRLGQDQQTIGIPIGPDTSLVISEILMHKCDAHLSQHIAQIKGSRFIDDFELSFGSQADAEEAHYHLEACLSEYELALNPTKTRILELPLPIEIVWATELRRVKPGASVSAQAAGLAILFDTAFGLYRKFPGEAVLQFAIAMMQFETIHPENWNLFQKLLMLCSLPEPASFPGAIRQIIQRVNTGLGPLIPEVSDISNSLIVSHSPLRHSSEVANAAWACLALGLTMNDASVDAISICDDPVVALLALDCEQRNLTSKPLDKTLWTTHMTAESLYDEFWLLAYEANIKNWLISPAGDFVAADPNFGILKTAGVFFYDSGLALPASPATPIAIPIAVPPVPADPAYSM